MWQRLLPAETTPDAGVLLTTRAPRAFVDGLVAVVVPSHLVARGLAGWQVGAVIHGIIPSASHSVRVKSRADEPF